MDIVGFKWSITCIEQYDMVPKPTNAHTFIKIHYIYSDLLTTLKF
jgi:hypothetical protein